MKESVIQRACLDLLEALRLKGEPVVATRTNSGRVQTVTGSWVQLARDGWPDITALIRGRFVGIETKCLGGKQRKAQAETQRMIEQAGGIYLLADRIEVLRGYLIQAGVLGRRQEDGEAG